VRYVLRLTQAKPNHGGWYLKHHIDRFDRPAQRQRLGYSGISAWIRTRPAGVALRLEGRE
jgi:hypothetical protein